MSAIPSLLRVMTLRDAEAIILEPGKIPSLRRKGAIEALAMPPLERAMLDEFAAPLIADKDLDAGPLQIPFATDEATYQVTVEKVASGLRLVVRKGTPRIAPRPSSSSSSTPADRVRTASDSGTATGTGTGTGTADRLPPTGTADRPPPTGTADRPPPTDTPTATATTADALARLHDLLVPFIAFARDRGASDLLLSTGSSVRLRIDGRLETLDAHLDDAELAHIVHALGSNTDHGLDVHGTRVRANAFDHLGGVGLAARLIRDRVPTLTDLALPPELAAIVEQRDGLVLVCGPTGSGKSTTLAALIDVLDQRRAAHVITLEDPIEYRFQPRHCLIHQRELGTHIPTFAKGLAAALREAPDVILLGELRDRDTIAAALTAAETGHLVLATLHAPNAAGAIDRIIDAFPDSQQRQIRWQLASVLRTIVTQYLLPRRDGGRAAAVELVPVTPAVANIMRKGDLHTLPNAINTGRDAGMIPLERSLAKLIDSGAVSPQSVKKIAADQDLLGALSSRLR